MSSTTLPGCKGLETGHGNMPEYGIYQCYGQVSSLSLNLFLLKYGGSNKSNFFKKRFFPYIL